MFCQRSPSNSQNITACQAAHSIGSSKDGNTTATTTIIRGRIITWTIARTQWTVAKQMEMCVTHHELSFAENSKNLYKWARSHACTHCITQCEQRNIKEYKESTRTWVLYTKPIQWLTIVDMKDSRRTADERMAISSFEFFAIYSRILSISIRLPPERTINGAQTQNNETIHLFRPFRNGQIEMKKKT